MSKIDKSIQINYSVINVLSFFSELEQDLISQSIENSKNAYAPYSKFNVSSGILLKNNKIILGNNVENASYPIGTCAERNVLSHTVTNYPNEIISCITIYGLHQINPKHQFISPCGMCRQALLEIEHHQKSFIKIILISDITEFMVFENVKSLLPFAFNSDSI